MDGDNDNPAGVPPSGGEASDTIDISVSTEPALREDQIQNAVSFLSHPKVRGSAVAAKRSFLEKKGLTPVEIDEAFKRVPEAPAAAAPTASVPATTSAPTYGANNLVTYTQQPSHAGQPGHVAQAGPAAGALVPVQPQHLQPLQPPPQPVRWTQVVLGLGVAAASLYGLHQLLAPRITAWTQQLSASRKAAQETEAARTAALTAALESLALGQAKLMDTLDGLAAAMQQQQQAGGASSQLQQGYSRQQGYTGYTGSDTGGGMVRGGQDEYVRCRSPGLAASSRQQQQQYQYAGPNSVDSTAHDASRAAGIRGWDPYDASRSAARAAAGYNAATAGPGSGYGARGSGYGGPGSSSHSPRHPMEAAGSSVAGVSGVPPDGFEVVPGGAGHQQPGQQQQQQSSSRPDDAPHSAAFHEVMEMVRQGITPPNVRTDINDTPPDPSRPISAPQLQPRGKPWERDGNVSSNSSRPAPFGSTAAAVGDNFQHQYGVGSSSSVPASGVVPDGPAGFGVTGYGYGGPAGGGVLSAGGSSLADAMESAADLSRRKGAEKAGGYDLSHLLGAGPGRTDEPWQPPPPPAPTVVQRPTSSGSSSSRTGGAMPAAAAAAAPQAGGPAAGPADVAAGPAGAGAAGHVVAEEVVANVAASAVHNVVAAAAACEAQVAAAGAPQDDAAEQL